MSSLLKLLYTPCDRKTHMEVLVKYLLYQCSTLSYKSRINAGETNLEEGSEQNVHMNTKPKLATPNVF